MFDQSKSGVLPDTGDDAGEWQALPNARDDGFERQLPPLFVRALPNARAQMRFQPDSSSLNVMGGLHGGFLAACAEQSLFLPLFLHGRVERAGLVVIDFTLSYLAGGNLDRPIVAEIEVLRETGRMAFLRGTLNQDGTVLTAYSATVRKLSKA
jgi:acyl-coenzyme A thioesterase PaaI-like protein